MKNLTLPEKDLVKLGRLADWLKEARGVEVELNLIADTAADVARRERDAKAAVDAVSPHGWLSFDAATEAAVCELRKAEFISRGMRVAEARLESCKARLRGDVRRAYQELTNAIRPQLQRGFQTPTGELPGKDECERAEALIAFCADHGLKPQEAHE